MIQHHPAPPCAPGYDQVNFGVLILLVPLSGLGIGSATLSLGQHVEAKKHWGPGKGGIIAPQKRAWLSGGQYAAAV